MSADLLNIEFKKIDGSTLKLGDIKARAYLIVNTASKCGLTPQYDALQSLYEKYKNSGLEIIAFPANNFLAQEPGNDNEIQEFCQLNYNVQFPVMSKISVKGDDIHPLFKCLISEKPMALKKEGSKFEDKLIDNGLLEKESKGIHWNFEKFLLDKDANIIERYFPDVDPISEIITNQIDKTLEG